MKMLIAVAGAATVAFSAAPADARPHNGMACRETRHGQCVAMRGGRNPMFRVGYRFDPRYADTPYNALPRTYVSRYGLRPNYRYVYRDNTIYVIDPRTYAIARVINALTG